MNLLDAHYCFRTLHREALDLGNPDRDPKVKSALPGATALGIVITREQDGRRFLVNGWPIAATASVSLSGQMGLCSTIHDLYAAMMHFHTHLCGTGFDDQDLSEEMDRVIEELERFGALDLELDGVEVP